MGQPPGPPQAPPPAAFPHRPRPERRDSGGKGGSAFVLILMLVFGMMAGGTCATLATIGGDHDQILGGRGERVGVVEVSGPIVTSDEITRQIREFARRDDLVALVLRIESPGGAVAPSQEIYQALREASAKKPVVASMGSTAASGGFWISLGADWVFASPGTITGSIGVITQTPDLTELAELARFRMRTFKSGPLKDAGNPFRALTEADEALFMGLINDIYDQFVTLTAERRGLPVEAVKKIADGRILTGRAALEADLVDELGGLWDAARKAVLLARARDAKEGGSTVDTSSAAYAKVEDPALVYPRPPKPKLLDLLQSRASRAMADGLVGAVDQLSERGSAPVELR
ncbi:MAG: signal peptide peptidase SppA [Deltaproteobacteria bacterium]|nr:signal peptide peptidase SppA [Deltaproteobacteria bacterium]